MASRSGSVRQRARLLRSEEHTSELQSQPNLVCRLLLEKKNGELRRSACPSGQARPSHGPVRRRDGTGGARRRAAGAPAPDPSPPPFSRPPCPPLGASRPPCRPSRRRSLRVEAPPVGLPRVGGSPRSRVPVDESVVVLADAGRPGGELVADAVSRLFFFLRIRGPPSFPLFPSRTLSQ